MSFFTPTTSLLLAAAYLLGSIPFGLLLAKLFAGSDIRKSGSGNIGATNVARVVGPAAGILTLVLDVAKGAAAVWLAARYSEQNSTALILAAIFALLGHCFPVWLRFKGGKGVATALGVFLMLSPLAALSALLVFIFVSLAWRYVSLGSVSAAAAMPLLMYFLWAPGHAPPLVVDFGTLFASALIIFKHDANLQRLVDGTEPKFSIGKSKGDAT
ncbi:MAG TPA: glycerol-3-phosphate 1-O-acyltransferase PlsY [Candidatus Sulfotelmatobacter sp.]|jgi:glycerol-3-phosphate acyltransferase PlsY|nr:glycerol-3-phosphate 1-O-acyltransferase PlsY [Candidatus Sulfotelmatobacter sp.]